MLILHKRNITILLATTFFVATFLTTAQSSTKPSDGYSKQQIIDQINHIAADSPYMPQKLSTMLEEINKNSADSSFEKNLESIVAKLLTITDKPEQQAQLAQIQKALLKRLQKYKASGSAFTHDFNGAFFVDGQNPRFTVNYKDATGNTKQRTYQADISLIGLNIELTMRLNFIFFTSDDFNFHNSNKVIELGTGIQICPTSSFLFLLPAAIDVTYVPFNNAPGGLFIVGLVLGPKIGGLSMVTGGTLTPVGEAS